jgi:hypothetical protein
MSGPFNLGKRQYREAECHMSSPFLDPRSALGFDDMLNEKQNIYIKE